MTTEFRVFGPPGTGKTTFLARQIALLAERYGPSSVFATSFTVAAAREIASRVSLPRTHVGTLHSICYRGLGQPEIAEAHTSEFRHLRVSQRSKERSDPGEPMESQGDRLLAQFNQMRAIRKPQDEWAPAVQKFAREWTDWKRANDYLDFTDLLEQAIAEHIAPPEGAFIGLFDEAQDLSPLQMQLIRQWRDEYLEQIVIAGDDDQTIFGHVGADPNLMLDPPVAEEHMRLLSQSYRLPRIIHAFATAWIERVKRRQPKVFDPRDEEGEIDILPFGLGEPERLAHDVAESAEKGTVMVLASCGYLLARVIEEFRDLGLMFHNPFRTSQGEWNPLRGNVVRDLTLLAAPSEKAYGALARRWTYGDLLRGMKLLRRTGVTRRGALRVLELETDQDKVIPRETLDDLFEEGAEAELLADPIKFVKGRVQKPRQQAFEYVARVVEKRGWSALDEEPRIVPGTIHSVKGGEADHVYLAPDLSRAGYETRNHDETTRQMYVGITRARTRLDLLGRGSASAVPWS